MPPSTRRVALLGQPSRTAYPSSAGPHSDFSGSPAPRSTPAWASDRATALVAWHRAQLIGNRYRDVPTRPIEAGHEAGLDRIAADGEHARNCLGRCLGRDRRGNRASHDHGHSMVDELGHSGWQSTVLAFPHPAVLDGYILAFDVAGFTKAAVERGDELRIRSKAAKKSDQWHRLLRPRRHRPRRRRAAKQRDDLTTFP